jgi:MIP family channel proteins
MVNNKFFAEMIGTFWLVFAGCGAIIVNDLHGGLGYLGVNFIFGLIVMALIYSIGNISGAHINPAVTLGFWFAGRLEGKVVVPYILSQCVGAVLASALLWWLFPEHENYGATIPKLVLLKSFVFEVVITFLLMFVILNVSTGHMEKGIMAGVAIGGTVALCALMGGVLTGASMNPARTLGPALFAGQYNTLWLYILGPILGAYLAHPMCKWIQGKDCCVSESSQC